MSTKQKTNSQIFQDSNDIFYPKDELEVSDLVKDFYKKNSSIELTGSNSKNFIGNKTQAANKVSLSKLSGIIEYFPEELYIKVIACTPLQEIEDALEKNDQELAFEPLDFGYIKNGKPNKGTIGGYLSCNYAGSRRFKVGSVRDHVLGFRGVNGKGDIIKSGGTVVKNVTGYDLSKLISGAFGTLVALTEITLKVLPKKQLTNTIVIKVDDKKKIYDLFDKIASSSSEITGAVFLPDEPDDSMFIRNKETIFKFNDLDFTGPYLALRLEGDKVSINEKTKKITKELDLKKFKIATLDNYQSSPFWKKINNLELFQNTQNNLLRIVIEPANGSEMMSYLGNKFKYYIDWCGSLFWVEVPPKKNNKVGEIKKKSIELGGYMTIIKTSEEYDYEETIFTVDPVRLMISEKIKKSFDPKRIFNPGKMYRGI
ncbi:FAD-binding protein [Candidatus Pelagibacter sp. HIMB1321]|uniref:FAD-binding protein n=1 Tax=Candidatus Pelagibacter sp. HIMB1321 TaxID=1388755 RepID=UPI000A07E007|nr:FAD-binding protein [Candidatus Pelagibacter sp. HIMB1321]SMF81154.1 glycolate oxidase FAD binding subunit [Candidatus Pelagibacter sp. HIMB1321]